ncbi:MAG: DUF2683 family protein [Flavobacterium sp.]
MEAIKFKAFIDNDSQVKELKDFMNSRKIKFELVKDDEYDPEFVAKVQTSRQQARDGEFVKIDLDNIWK